MHITATSLYMFQSLLPEKFHHLLCSYIPLGCHDERAADSCIDIGTCNHSSERDEMTELPDVSDASCGYCLSASEANETVDCEQAAAMCQLSPADAVTADELLHVLSNSHVKTVRSNCQPSSCADSFTDADTHAVTADSSNADVCDKWPTDLHIGRVGFKAKLRVNVETLTELELWQKEFAERSKTTMRYANVSMCTGRKTLYKVIVVCYVDYMYAYFSIYELALAHTHTHA